MNLHELKAPKGSRKRKVIVGRGRGSGCGKTSGRGHKGQKSRTGSGILIQSEGGQMPLIRRLPKVGFTSKRPVIYQVVKLKDLSRFKENTVINSEFLKSHDLIKSVYRPVKILGDGEIKKPLTIKVNAFSKSAEDKISKAGGKVEKVDLRAEAKDLKAKSKEKLDKD